MLSLFDISPPMTAVRWSCTNTVVDADRIVVVGPFALFAVLPSTFDSSSYRSTLKYPPSDTCGTMSNVIPTFCRCTLLKICPGRPALADADPTNGRFCPTTMVASVLSAVKRVGADSTLECVSACSAVTSNKSHGTVVVVLVVDPLAVDETEQLLPDARPSPSPV